MLLPLSLGTTYDYWVPDGLSLNVGDVVRVPLGPRVISGVVWGAGESAIEDKNLKDVVARHDCPPLPDVSHRFITWVARYTMHMPGAVLKMALSVPDALEPSNPITAYSAGDVGDGLRITPARRRILNAIANGPPRTAAELSREANVSPSVVKGLANAGALKPEFIAAVAIPPAPDADHPGPKLSNDQNLAALRLVDAVEAGGFGAILLDGVPGAGKRSWTPKMGLAAWRSLLNKWHVCLGSYKSKRTKTSVSRQI